MKRLKETEKTFQPITTWAFPCFISLCFGPQYTYNPKLNAMPMSCSLTASTSFSEQSLKRRRGRSYLVVEWWRWSEMNEGFWIKDFHCFVEGGELYDGFYRESHIASSFSC